MKPWYIVHALVYSAVIAAAGEPFPPAGSTEDEVRRLLGEPKASVGYGETRKLIYGGGIVTMQKGRLVESTMRAAAPAKPGSVASTPDGACVTPVRWWGDPAAVLGAPTLGAEGEPAVEAPRPLPDTTSRRVEGSAAVVVFHDPARDMPYWASLVSRHRDRSSAIEALSVQFEESTDWVEQNMGTSNDLAEIQRSLVAAKTRQLARDARAAPSGLEMAGQLYTSPRPRSDHQNPTVGIPAGFVWTGDREADQRRLDFVRELQSGHVRTFQDLERAVREHSTAEEVQAMEREFDRQDSRFNRAIPDPNHPGAWIWPKD